MCPRKRLSFLFCITGRLFGYILCRQKTKATRICLTVGFTHFMIYSLFTTYCNFHISLVFFIRTNFQLFAFFFCLNSIYSLPRTAFISFIFLLSFIHFCHLFSFLLRSGRPNHEMRTLHPPTLHLLGGSTLHPPHIDTTSPVITSPHSKLTYPNLT